MSSKEPTLTTPRRTAFFRSDSLGEALMPRAATTTALIMSARRRSAALSKLIGADERYLLSTGRRLFDRQPLLSRRAAPGVAPEAAGYEIEAVATSSGNPHNGGRSRRGRGGP